MGPQESGRLEEEAPGDERNGQSDGASSAPTCRAATEVTNRDGRQGLWGMAEHSEVDRNKRGGTTRKDQKKRNSTRKEDQHLRDADRRLGTRVLLDPARCGQEQQKTGA